jgi:DNA-binding MarR family transcriptional regulator
MSKNFIYIGQQIHAVSVKRYSVPDLELGILQMQVLWLLGKAPTHGYSLIKELNKIKKTKVTAGVLYPVLAKLVKLGFIRVTISGRRKVYALTPAGRRAMVCSCGKFCGTFEGIFKDFVCGRCR